MNQPPDRTVRSFVRRDSRITSGQKTAIEQHWKEYGLDATDTVIDLSKSFGRTAPIILDIGSGMGDSTVQLAKNNPDNNYLAVEVHMPGVGSLILKSVAEKVHNIRVISDDIVIVLEQHLNAQSIDAVCIYFPDPWHKRRHHKRRLINTGFMQRLKRVLKPQARIFIATDWQDYAKQIASVCDNDNDLINLAGKGNMAPRPLWRPLTKFEKRGEKLGHNVWDFIYALK